MGICSFPLPRISLFFLIWLWWGVAPDPILPYVTPSALSGLSTHVWAKNLDRKCEISRVTDNQLIGVFFICLLVCLAIHKDIKAIGQRFVFNQEKSSLTTSCWFPHHSRLSFFLVLRQWDIVCVLMMQSFSALTEFLIIYRCPFMFILHFPSLF